MISGLLGVALVAAWTGFRIQQQGSSDEQRPADAIVVLGAAQYNGQVARSGARPAQRP